MNGMIYLRGSKNDYNTWEKLGNNGWSYKQVLPYFLKSENNLEMDEVQKKYHSDGGYMPVTKLPYQPSIAEDILKGVKELGHNVGRFDDAQQRRFAIVQTTTKNGIRHSAARNFLRPVKNRINLDIMLNTTVSKVLIDHSRKVAYGIEIITASGTKKKIMTSKEVIVCGGSVNSPQLLLLSGVGSKNALEDVGIPVVHNLPGVGKNLHDHVAFLVRFTINEVATNDLDYASAMQYLLERNGPLSATGLSQLSGFIDSRHSNTSEGNPDIQILFWGYSASCSQTGVVGEIDTDKVNGTLPKREVIIIPVVVNPKSRGYLTLRDKNPLSHPKIFARYLTESIDVAKLVDGVKFAIRLSKTATLKKYGFKVNKTPAKGCEALRFGSDEYWTCAIRANTYVSHHQVGSCKMGPDSDPTAVVDCKLRVHGVRGLRVIDASIMPNAPSGNTYVPTIMVAEKGSDMIKETWLNQ